MEAQNKLDETQIEDLTETRSQLSELEGLLVPWFPLLGLTPSGLFMGLIST